MIDIALLGCGGSMPIPNRFLTSLLISHQGRKILIDCGEGTQVSMKMLGWGFKTIDVICLTHFHLDHIVGLPGLLSTIGNSGRTEPLTLLGPIGLNDYVRGLRIMVPYLPYELKIYEIEDDTNYNFSPELIIKTIYLMHTSPCLGFRFEIKRKPQFDPIKAESNQIPKIFWNKLQKGETINFENRVFEPYMVLGNERKGIAFSYITDTRPIEKISEFVAGSNLFFCEGMYGNDNDLNKAIINKHMIFSEAALIAKKSKVKELILTHFSPMLYNPEEFLNNASKIFNNTIVGFDRLTRTLNFNNDKN